MTKKEIKQYLKQYGIYELIHDLVIDKTLTSDDLFRYEEIIYSFLDNIPQLFIDTATKKASR